MTGARLTLGVVHLDMLAMPEAEEFLTSALRLAQEIGSLNFIRVASSSLASLYLHLHRFADAERVLDAALPPDGLMTSVGLRGCWFARAALSLAREDANTTLDIVERLMASTDAGVSGSVWHVRGDALARLGRAAEALDVLETARLVAREQVARNRVWRIDASLARVLRGMGRREDAERVLAEARSTLHDLAANIDDPRLREAFLREAAAWVPAPPAPTARQAAKQRFAGLTAREREVARLVARGSSNRAIADQLIVGERTVESYVGNILTKLGFNSRTQIAAWVVESGLAEADD
jgi:DNA-binding CsgD family transcriptional regulator